MSRLIFYCAILMIASVSTWAVEKEKEKGDVKTWKRYQNAGEKALKGKDTLEAERQFALAVDEAERLPKGESRLRDSLKDLAPLLVSHRKYDRAQAAYERLCALYAQELGSNDLKVGYCLVGLGQAYAYGQRPSAAEQALLRARKILETKLGSLHPNMVFVQSGLANLYVQTGRYNEAEALYKSAIQIADSPRVETDFRGDGLMQTHYRPQYELAAALMNDLALLYRAQSRVADAEATLERALKTYEDAKGSQSSGAAMVLHNLGILYLRQKDFARAEVSLTRALAIREKTFGSRHPAVADTLDALGEATELRDHEKAHAFRMRARDIRINAR
jgi:tetratricopeptide (TPR) repeat protein